MSLYKPSTFCVSFCPFYFPLCTLHWAEETMSCSLLCWYTPYCERSILFSAWAFRWHGVCCARLYFLLSETWSHKVGKKDSRWLLQETHFPLELQQLEHMNTSVPEPWKLLYQKNPEVIYYNYSTTLQVISIIGIFSMQQFPIPQSRTWKSDFWTTSLKIPRQIMGVVVHK